MLPASSAPAESALSTSTPAPTLAPPEFAELCLRLAVPYTDPGTVLDECMELMFMHTVSLLAFFKSNPNGHLTYTDFSILGRCLTLFAPDKGQAPSPEYLHLEDAVIFILNTRLARHRREHPSQTMPALIARITNKLSRLAKTRANRAAAAHKPSQTQSPDCATAPQQTPAASLSQPKRAAELDNTALPTGHSERSEESIRMEPPSGVRVDSTALPCGDSATAAPTSPPRRQKYLREKFRQPRAA